jgi:hypothetical protein
LISGGGLSWTAIVCRLWALSQYLHCRHESKREDG